MTACLILISLTFADCEKCGNKGELTCPDCKGEFRTTGRVPCDREGGVGCDSRGFRQCFKCRGDGSLRCEGCDGDGMTSVRRVVGRSSSGRAKYGYREEACGMCRDALSRTPTGRIDCPECHDLWLTQREVGAEIVGESRPGDANERSLALRARRSTWVYHEAGRGLGQKFVGMIRCPRCLGRGTYEDTILCSSCKAGKIVCPECNGKSAIAHQLGECPFKLIHAMRLKQSAVRLDDSTRDSLSVVIDEYMRLRNALDRFAKDENWAELIETIQASDERVAAAADDDA